MKKKLKINRMIMIAVILYFIYVIISQQQTLNSLRQESATYEKQKVEATEETNRLKEVRNNLNSTEYIENVAREKLGMYLPNERVYIDITK